MNQQADLRQDRLERCFRQVLTAQIILAVFVMLMLALLVSIKAASSAFLGALLAVVNTWLNRRSVQRSSALAYSAPQLSMAPVFTGLFQRILLFSVGFVLGVQALHLLPLFLLVGFIVLQAGYVACKMT